MSVEHGSRDCFPLRKVVGVTVTVVIVVRHVAMS